MSDFDNELGIPEIAVVGLAGRFPEARTLDTFWANLRDGVESIRFFSEEELVQMGIPAKIAGHPDFVAAATPLDGVETFDAGFFGFTPAEAEVLDPQSRILLETAWEALEHAGYSPESPPGPIGVYAGCGPNEYEPKIPAVSARDVAGSFQILTSNAKDFVATRVSHLLDLKGPSLTIQTACSTSLVAIHVACQSLLNYQCSVALAGGVAVTLERKAGYFRQEGMILSPDGHCRAFDAGAKGTILGQGAGLVVLKRLSEALEEGDTIHAVIKGSALNNDGSHKVNFTAPSVVGQTEVIRAAQDLAGVDASSITYIETHGTGTSLGDPIEIEALTDAFRETTDRKGYCAIGSLKTNIGHLDAAAGVAAIIKTILALKHKQIPPSLHFEKPNPNIDFENSPFFVNTKLREWTTDGGPRRAGVSSFGIGGTNAHVILEEAPVQQPTENPRPWQLLTLSAKTETALDSVTVRLAQNFRDRSEVSLADAAYTLQQGRTDFDYRRILVCRSPEDAQVELEGMSKRVLTSRKPLKRDIAFLFSGQGSQYPNMGRDLYQSGETFRRCVDECAELLHPYLDFDLLEILYPKNKNVDEATQRLTQTSVAQPALFVVEYALARQWMEWGIEPAALVGHSIGEYVAACLAGVMSSEDALRLVAVRGRLMQSMPVGSMLSVALPEENVRKYLGDDTTIATINGNALCVVSGETAAINELERRLCDDRVATQRLHTSHAFHSKMMDPILESFAVEVAKVKLHVPRIPLVSNVSGTWFTDVEATDPAYWSKQIRQAVRFNDNLGELMKDTRRVLLEVGPGKALATFAAQHSNKGDAHVVVGSLRHPKEQISDAVFLLTALGRVWMAGVKVDWDKLHKQKTRRRIPLPTYPFEEQRYWAQDERVSKSTQLPQEREALTEWFYLPSWTRTAPRVLSTRPLPSSCLVFMDEAGLGIEVEAEINARNAVAVSIYVGDKFERFDEHKYIVDPARAEHYDRLLEELARNGLLPSMIIHLWSLDTPDVPLIEKLDRSQDQGFYSLLFLAQAIGRLESSHDVEIYVVTGGIHNVVGTETIHPDQATVLGSTKVIPLEYSNIRCRSIDFTPSARRAAQLLDEISSGSEEPIVAFRGMHRWTPDVTPAPIGPQTSSPAVHLREGGVYLITGGLSGIGLEIARYLARTVHAKLILVGRTSVPPREEWETKLAQLPKGDTIHTKLEKLLMIEADGAELLVVAGDVADLERMRQVIGEAHDRFGPIQGLIHSAGVADDSGVIQKRTRAIHERSVESKVRGTVVLTHLLKSEEMDFCVLNSSMSTVLYHNRFAQVGYVAANSFLGAFCDSKDHCLGHLVTIDWDDWQQVGMSVRAEKRFTQEYNLGEPLFDPLDQFTPEEGVEIFTRLMSTDYGRVLISTRDLALRIEQDEFAVSPFLAAAEKIEFSDSAHARPDVSTTFVSPKTPVEQKVASAWQGLLGIEGIGIEDDFFELGGHSLLATQLNARLRETFRVDLPLQSLFEGPTVRQIAERIDLLRAESVEAGVVEGEL